MNAPTNETDCRRLSHDQYFTIRSHVRERYLDKKKLPSTFSQYAKKLTKDLGFPVAAASLATICAAEGITSTHAASGGSPRTGQIAQLTQLIEQLIERVTTLERYVLTLEVRIDTLETRLHEIAYK